MMQECSDRRPATAQQIALLKDFEKKAGCKFGELYNGRFLCRYKAKGMIKFYTGIFSGSIKLVIENI
jgi:hypothetical protein